MPRWHAVILVAALPCAACASASESAISQGPTPVSLAQPFTLRAGAAVVLRNENLEVGFERVVSDSRCPRGAQCITEGEAVVLVRLSKRPAPGENRRLSTKPDAGETVYGRYRIKLVALEPQPAVDRTIPGSDYAATFLVTLAD